MEEHSYRRDKPHSRLSRYLPYKHKAEHPTIKGQDELQEARGLKCFSECTSPIPQHSNNSSRYSVSTAINSSCNSLISRVFNISRANLEELFRKASYKPHEVLDSIKSIEDKFYEKSTIEEALECLAGLEVVKKKIAYEIKAQQDLLFLNQEVVEASEKTALLLTKQNKDSKLAEILARKNKATNSIEDSFRLVTDLEKWKITKLTLNSQKTSRSNSTETQRRNQIMHAKINQKIKVNKVKEKMNLIKEEFVNMKYNIEYFMFEFKHSQISSSSQTNFFCLEKKIAHKLKECDELVLDNAKKTKRVAKCKKKLSKFKIDLLNLKEFVRYQHERMSYHLVEFLRNKLHTYLKNIVSKNKVAKRQTSKKVFEIQLKLSELKRYLFDNKKTFQLEVESMLKAKEELQEFCNKLIESVKKLQKENSELKTSLSEYQKDKLKLQENLSHYERKMNTVNNDSLSSENSELKAQIRLLKTQYDNLIKENVELYSNFNLKECIIKGLEEHIEEQKKHSDDYHEKILETKFLEQKCRDLEREKKVLSNKNHFLVRKLFRIKEFIFSRFKSEHESLRIEMQDIKSDFASKIMEARDMIASVKHNNQVMDQNNQLQAEFQLREQEFYLKVSKITEENNQTKRNIKMLLKNYFLTLATIKNYFLEKKKDIRDLVGAMVSENQSVLADFHHKFASIHRNLVHSHQNQMHQAQCLQKKLAIYLLQQVHRTSLKKLFKTWKKGSKDPEELEKMELIKNNVIMKTFVENGSMNETPMQSSQLMKVLEDMLDAKYESDCRDIKASRKPLTMTDFMVQYLKRKYGMDQLASTHLSRIILALKKLNKENDMYGRFYCRILQLFHPDPVPFELSIYLVKERASFIRKKDRLKQEPVSPQKLRNENSVAVTELVSHVIKKFQREQQVGEVIIHYLRPDSVTHLQWSIFIVQFMLSRKSLEPEMAFEYCDYEDRGFIGQEEFTTGIRVDLGCFILQDSADKLYQWAQRNESTPFMSKERFCELLRTKVQLEKDKIKTNQIKYLTAIMEGYYFMRKQHTEELKEIYKQTIGCKPVTSIEEFFELMLRIDPELTEDRIEDLFTEVTSGKAEVTESECLKVIMKNNIAGYGIGIFETKRLNYKTERRSLENYIGMDHDDERIIFWTGKRQSSII